MIRTESNEKNKIIKGNHLAGFSSNVKTILKESNSTELNIKTSSNSLNFLDPVSIILTVRGLQYYCDKTRDDASLANGTEVFLEREPENEYDANAIRVVRLLRDNKNSKEKIGHIAAEEAVILAYLMDNNRASLSSAHIKIQKQNALKISVDVTTTLEDHDVISTLTQLKILGPIGTEASNKLSKVDLETSFTAGYTMPSLKGQKLPWRPLAEGGDIWPPSLSVLTRLGLGAADDVSWWNQMGLKPPVQWKVSGAYDLLKLPQIRLKNKTQIDRTISTFDG